MWAKFDLAIHIYKQCQSKSAINNLQNEGNPTNYTKKPYKYKYKHKLTQIPHTQLAHAVSFDLKWSEASFNLKHNLIIDPWTKMNSFPRSLNNGRNL